MRRLGVKLALNVALVAILASVLTAFGIHWRISSRFETLIHDQVLRRSGEAGQALVGYYAEHGSWVGVQTFLNSGPRGIHFLITFRYYLLDASGRIVAASDAGDIGRRRSGECCEPVPLLLGGKTVGTLRVEIPPRPFSKMELDFLRAVAGGVVTAAAIALVLSALVGVLLARQFTAPLDRLVVATRRLAAGERSQRVPTGAADEIDELSHAFNDLSASLEQQERLRKNLLADVAHELRTPLSVMLANFEAIQDGAVSSAPEALLPLHDEALRMARLVSDLQDLSLAEAGQLPLHRRPCALAPVVEGVVAALEPEAAAHGLSLRSDLSPNLPELDLDPDRITQVLANLVTNALRYTPDGGRITIAAHLDAPGGVAVTVSDTGEGIAPDDLPHVFDRFWRGESSRSRSTGGSGLGLAIVRGLIQAHGGTIQVASTRSEGTTFRFSLPIAGQPADATPPA